MSDETEVKKAMGVNIPLLDQNAFWNVVFTGLLTG